MLNNLELQIISLRVKKDKNTSVFELANFIQKIYKINISVIRSIIESIKGPI